MYVTLILDEGRETRSQNIYMNRNIISVLEILKSFGIEKLDPQEKIWIKRLNFDKFNKDAYTIYSVLEWDKFNGCEIAISPKYPDKSEPSVTAKSSQDSSWSKSTSRRKALEEMFIMDLVIKNQNKK